MADDEPKRRVKVPRDLLNVAGGFLMGGADIVPGVSGGTVALIIGIYDRLVRAISRVDTTWLAHVRGGRWKAAAEYIDLRFLATLGIGIVTGILGLASLMHYLLEDQEHVTIHSINRETGEVRLNVGTHAGGIDVGETLTVYRRNAKTDRFERIGQLRLERYVDDDSTDTVRLAVASQFQGIENDRIRMTDVVTQPSRRRPLTLAAFFGLILGSTVLVAKMMERWTIGSLLVAVLGAVFAYWLVGRFPIAPYAGKAYLFVCGMLAICAMILPGISGAFILLLLGVYSDVTGLLRGVLNRQATPDSLLSIVVFVCGCAIGLIAFSKFLNRLLRDYRDVTMAALCGFMLGSLRKIWPFKIDLTPDRAKFKLKLFENTWPEPFDGRVWLTFGIMLAATAAVFLLERLTAGPVEAPFEDRGSAD